ncbi:apolipoprotein C-I [Pipistrellus kuhlii]|uniref:apolipoprotein C-I n=1 Tax=Pipistrellus kuhlii TaxID=59472 RepID=UPI001E26EDEB|nr:apolipoprotein C-I [Pipistrellus kuhlii]
MKLLLSLSVLAVALLMVLEGPAPAQANSSIQENLRTFGTTVKEKTGKSDEIPAVTQLDLRVLRHGGPVS